MVETCQSSSSSSSSSRRRQIQQSSMIIAISYLMMLSNKSTVTSKTQMFDLIVDPNESESTHGDTTYDDVKLYMESRIPSFWVSAIREPDMNDVPGETVIKQQWDNCQTTCPWTLNTAQYDIEHKYAYPKAPHIVFILVDDWGYNDVGYRSTSMTWTTPTIDKLAAEGVILNNYFTHESCVPSRGALMTGRQAIRLGLQGAVDDFGPELPLAEVTLAQELKSAGYKTYLVGKWHLGMSSAARTPTYRGFDYFYGYYNSYIDYWTKSFQGYNDLHEGLESVTDPKALDEKLFSQFLFQQKAEKVITNHALIYKTYPMFLLYSMQLVHAPYQVPAVYSSRCTNDGNLLDDDVYCGMNVLLDEAIANITCALDTAGMSENTVLVVTSANGGSPDSTEGTNVPFRGYKGNYYRGGLGVNAFIHSPLIPLAARGTQYDGQMHVTDWMPTLMGLATKNTWTGSIAGASVALDGKDMWSAIVSGGVSPRHEILHYVKSDGLAFSIQYDLVKLDTNNDMVSYGAVSLFYPADQSPEDAHFTCPAPSLMSDDAGVDVVHSDDTWPNTPKPTIEITAAPTFHPPTYVPTPVPSAEPSTARPSDTSPPSFRPVPVPSFPPTFAPSNTDMPTATPTFKATDTPTDMPTTVSPSPRPSYEPTYKPTTRKPTYYPSHMTYEPSAIPTAPSPAPSTQKPSKTPTLSPTSSVPTSAPTKRFDVKMFVSHNESYLIVSVFGLAWTVYFIMRYCPCCKCCESEQENDGEPINLKPANQTGDKTPLLRPSTTNTMGKLINNPVAGGAANAGKVGGGTAGLSGGGTSSEMSLFSSWRGLMNNNES